LLAVRTVIRRSYVLVVGLTETVSPRPPRLHRISTMWRRCEVCLPVSECPELSICESNDVNVSLAREG
jgi:hypothetical protein